MIGYEEDGTEYEFDASDVEYDPYYDDPMDPTDAEDLW